MSNDGLGDVSGWAKRHQACAAGSDPPAVLQCDPEDALALQLIPDV